MSFWNFSIAKFGKNAESRSDVPVWPVNQRNIVSDQKLNDETDKNAIQHNAVPTALDSFCTFYIYQNVALTGLLRVSCIGIDLKHKLFPIKFHRNVAYAGTRSDVPVWPVSQRNIDSDQKLNDETGNNAIQHNAVSTALDSFCTFYIYQNAALTGLLWVSCIEIDHKTRNYSR